MLTRNTLWNYTGFVVNLATNLIMFPFVVSRIGEAAAGVWLLVGAITGYMGLLELGIVPSLAQTTAASLARGDRDAINRSASSALALLCALCVLSLSLTLLVQPAVNWLYVPDAMVGPTVTAFYVAIVGFALRMPLAMFQAVLLGHQRQDRCNQLWILIGVTKLVAAVVVLNNGGALVALLVTEMGIHLVFGGFQIRWVFQEAPYLRLARRFVSRAEATKLLWFGGAILAVAVASLVIEQTDRLVIAAFLPVAMVTYYAAAWKIYMLAFVLTTTFVQAVAPVAADLHGREDIEGLRRLFLRSTRYTAAIAWPLVLSLAFAGGFLLKIWMGAQFVVALPIIQVLLVGFAVLAHNHAGYSILIGMRRVGPTVWQYFAPQAILNLVLSVWLVQRLGSVGVALGTMIPALALEYFFLRFVLAELRLDWAAFLRTSVRPIALRALASFAPLALLYTRSDPAAPVLLAGAAACTLLYAIQIWWMLDVDERAAVVKDLPALAGVRDRLRMRRSTHSSMRVE